MKCVILAGGLGTRLTEETQLKPKPMIEIGGKPLLWHVMKLYSSHGINDFIVCCGYRGYVIKEYFANYFLHMSDVTFDIASNKMEVHHKKAEAWRVTVVDTGEETMTGGRIRRIGAHIGEGTFCLTYGDGVSNVDINAALKSHQAARKKATVTAVRPPGRFGSLDIVDGEVTGFNEKPDGDGGWINGGFFVLEPSVLELIEGDTTIWERQPLEQLSRNGELNAFQHEGFWQPMDTLRDKLHLEDLWNSGKAPWRIW
jgi:glucose-1-phosphate cytidylyltransferase